MHIRHAFFTLSAAIFIIIRYRENANTCHADAEEQGAISGHLWRRRCRPISACLYMYFDAQAMFGLLTDMSLHQTL